MFWQDKSNSTSSSSLSLTRRMINDALKEVIKNSNTGLFILSLEATTLIQYRFNDILNRNVQDNSEYLEKLLKAIINTIFLENRYSHPDASKLVYSNENQAFSQAIEDFNQSDQSIEKFEQAILATVPPDGRVFMLNGDHLKPLQDLANKCGITLNRAVRVEQFETLHPSLAPTVAKKL